MMPEDFGRFEKAIGKLSMVFGKDLSPETTQAYLRALNDMPIEVIEQRVDSHIRHGKFFPKPAELRPKEDKPRQPLTEEFLADVRRSDEANDRLWAENRELWLKTVSPKVYELGRAKGMTDGAIAQKLANYRPARLKSVH